MRETQAGAAQFARDYRNRLGRITPLTALAPEFTLGVFNEMMAGRHPQDADLWRNQWAESIPDGMRPAPLNLGGACAELEWQKDNLRVLAAALAERKVWFWGCGAAYAAFKQLFSATKPLGILADLSTAGGNPPAIDGLAVMHPESIDPRKGKFPVVVFARQEHVETIREKLTTRYRELVDQSMIVYCVL